MTIHKKIGQKPPSQTNRRPVFLDEATRNELNEVVSLWRQQTGMTWTQKNVIKKLVTLALEGEIAPAVDVTR